MGKDAKFNVIDGNSALVLAAGLTRDEAVTWAIKWADENGCNSVTIREKLGRVVVSKV
jgi:hypothetical protein